MTYYLRCSLGVLLAWDQQEIVTYLLLSCAMHLKNLAESEQLMTALHTHLNSQEWSQPRKRKLDAKYYRRHQIIVKLEYTVK